MSSIAAGVPGADLPELVAAAGAIAAELAARPAPQHPDACMEQAEVLGRAADLIEAAIASRVAVADRQAEPQRSGFPSTTSWLRTRLGMRHSRADDRAVLARQLSRLPQVSKRLAADELSFGYASVIAGALRRLDDDEAAKGEAILLGMVDDGCSVKEITAAGDRIKQLIAERDGTDRPPEDARRGERQRWTMHRTSGGRALSKGSFSAELAALIRAKIEPLAKPVGPEDTRDHGQRMADALQTYLSEGGTAWDPILIIELNQPIWRPRSRSSRPQSGDGEQLLDDRPASGAGHDAPVPAPAEACLSWALDPPPATWPFDGTAFTARLPDGTPIPAQRARQILLAAGFSALLLGADGHPLYLGRKVRFATGHQRRVLNTRYQTCVVTGCDIPAELCQLDHVEPWFPDGVTDIDKLVPCCGWHNRHKWDHPDRYLVSRRDDGRYRYDLALSFRPRDFRDDRRPGHNPTDRPPERGP